MVEQWHSNCHALLVCMGVVSDQGVLSLDSELFLAISIFLPAQLPVFTFLVSLTPELFVSRLVCECQIWKKMM